MFEEKDVTDARTPRRVMSPFFFRFSCCFELVMTMSQNIQRDEPRGRKFTRTHAVHTHAHTYAYIPSTRTPHARTIVPKGHTYIGKMIALHTVPYCKRTTGLILARTRPAKVHGIPWHAGVPFTTLSSSTFVRHTHGSSTHPRRLAYQLLKTNKLTYSRFNYVPTKSFHQYLSIKLWILIAPSLLYFLCLLFVFLGWFKY
ncbi:hypothetical protein DM02DRAFT_10593 [Periconia macrospinosa]|uniref:Uncharacterized protein n=1 Tax=Periconia macrospinosa TaxID=97972 RepID=A0A2V1EF78_9PLEO|nr:hypothetical protein DM02DRAFT_10593 [Periconia macrospinosa]